MKEQPRVQDDGPVILAVTVPPQRVGWLARELAAAGLPYEVQRNGDAYNLYTLPAAGPVVERVMNYTPKTQQRQTGGIRPRPWLVGGAVFALLFGLFDLSTWGHAERTIPRLLDWSQGQTAGAFAVCALLVGVWWRLATGKPPAGYRPIIPGWLLLLLLLVVVGVVFWLAANGALY